MVGEVTSAYKCPPYILCIQFNCSMRLEERNVFLANCSVQASGKGPGARTIWKFQVILFLGHEKQSNVESLCVTALVD